MTLLRTIFGAILFLIGAILVFWLVYSNDQPTAFRFVGLWGGAGVPNPFAGVDEPADLQLPLGLWLLGFLFLGIIIGLFAGWFIAGSTRIQARQQARRARRGEAALEAAETEIQNLKSELKKIETAHEQYQRLGQQTALAKEKPGSLPN